MVKFTVKLTFNEVKNDITTVESLQFDFASIEAATRKFSDDNKLGKGGFGEVYKRINISYGRASRVYSAELSEAQELTCLPNGGGEGREEGEGEGEEGEGMEGGKQNMIGSSWMLLDVVDDDITTVESLQFDFASIEAATRKFSDDSKLGGGGFGEVYKGKRDEGFI
ncbi:putative cysteine-rich receptor-like protein kinase 35 isoform X2 [Tripterygium wilfordii]|uniref:Putative cysteine-rich receptor-like protein kinase 35 isoform X2 n=1 Tax=Tripterygium wilfordii TaxID=458696 RepID=A0A7J7C3A5_TRIWF|nr:putative cysteine-rich receptor-like protein kinase 35 isoform X2 [Tripterygium wilfordii]